MSPIFSMSSLIYIIFIFLILASKVCLYSYEVIFHFGFNLASIMIIDADSFSIDLSATCMPSLEKR